MEPSEPIPPESIRQLLKQATETAYCRPALRDLGVALPADDGTFIAALHEAAAMRDAKAFSHLYLSGLLAGRRVPAGVLEFDSALLPEAMLLLHTASPPVTLRSGKQSAPSSSAPASSASASPATIACSLKSNPPKPSASPISSSAATSTAGSLAAGGETKKGKMYDHGIHRIHGTKMSDGISALHPAATRF